MTLTDYNTPGSELLPGGRRAVSARALPSKTVMAHPIEVGTVFIEEAAPLPESLKFESEPYPNGWRSVKNLNGYELDRKIREVGWTLFDLAPVEASAFGFDTAKATRRAVSRILDKTRRNNFNALEINQVAVRRFLGVPYVTVCAHTRQIQESMFLLHDKRLAKGNQAKLAYSRAVRRGW